jgi:hypothetical protein
MPAKRRFRFLSPTFHAGRRAALLAVAAVIVLAVGATPALATTGSVYYDSNNNVGAGHDFFGGTTPTGSDNVGLGFSVMPALTSGSDNIAAGSFALVHNTTGSDNIATGFAALINNNANSNVATGSEALLTNTTGHNNVGEGFEALLNATGSRNVALGSAAGANLTSGSDNIDIANPGVAGDAGTIRIGTTAKQSAAFLAGVYGKAVGATSKAVVVNPNGKLGTAPAPAAPRRSQSKTLDRLRAQNRRQGDKLRQLTAVVQRLREQMRNGG